MLGLSAYLRIGELETPEFFKVLRVVTEADIATFNLLLNCANREVSTSQLAIEWQSASRANARARRALQSWKARNRKYRRFVDLDSLRDSGTLLGPRIKTLITIRHAALARLSQAAAQ